MDGRTRSPSCRYSPSVTARKTRLVVVAALAHLLHGLCGVVRLRRRCTSGMSVTTCSKRRGADMLLLVNFAVFELAWLSSVIGGAREMPWLGPLAVLIALAIHLRAARKPFDEVSADRQLRVMGVCFDSELVAAGWVTYKAGLFSEYVAPYWIITMWMLFATTLNVSMRWLRGKPQAGCAVRFFWRPRHLPRRSEARRHHSDQSGCRPRRPWRSAGRSSCRC